MTIVLQVQSGQGGWLAFRRYRTRNGRFELVYPFRRTTRPTEYVMRAQVREAVGYPYLEGDSNPLTLRVIPGAPRKGKKSVARRRCEKKTRASRRGPKRCSKKRRTQHRAPAKTRR